MSNTGATRTVREYVENNIIISILASSLSRSSLILCFFFLIYNNLMGSRRHRLRARFNNDSEIRNRINSKTSVANRAVFRGEQR